MSCNKMNINIQMITLCSFDPESPPTGRDAINCPSGGPGSNSISCNDSN